MCNPLGVCWILNTGVAVSARCDLSSKDLFSKPGSETISR